MIHLFIASILCLLTLNANAFSCKDSLTTRPELANHTKQLTVATRGGRNVYRGNSHIRSGSHINRGARHIGRGVKHRYHSPQQLRKGKYLYQSPRRIRGGNIVTPSRTVIRKQIRKQNAIHHRNRFRPIAPYYPAHPVHPNARIRPLYGFPKSYRYYNKRVRYGGTSYIWYAPAAALASGVVLTNMSDCYLMDSTRGTIQKRYSDQYQDYVYCCMVATGCYSEFYN